MSNLSYLVQGKIDDAKVEVDGKTLGRPVLLTTDGVGLTYCVDVDIGQKVVDRNTDEEVVAPLRNVPIAQGNNELLYADAGAAVRVRRSSSGRYEVVGFSKRLPGTYTRVPVRIPAPGLGPVPYEFGAATSVGLSARRLTYGELGTIGSYGTTPYGAIGRFRGDVLIEVI
jgi:hypothetical protein